MKKGRVTRTSGQPYFQMIVLEACTTGRPVFTPDFRRLFVGQLAVAGMTVFSQAADGHNAGANRVEVEVLALALTVLERQRHRLSRASSPPVLPRRHGCNLHVVNRTRSHTLPTGRWGSEVHGAEEDAGCVTAPLARILPLGDWRTLRARLIVQFVKSQNLTSLVRLVARPGTVAAPPGARRRTALGNVGPWCREPPQPAAPKTALWARMRPEERAQRVTEGAAQRKALLPIMATWARTAAFSLLLGARVARVHFRRYCASAISRARLPTTTESRATLRERARRSLCSRI